MTSRTDSPAEYRIRVQGQLKADWADWFYGLTVTAEAHGETVIAGVVADQPALHGLLKKIRDLGLLLISVQRGPETITPCGNLDFTGAKENVMKFWNNSDGEINPKGMILLSRALLARGNQWANIAAGTVATLVQTGSLFFDSAPAMCYQFFSLTEIAVTAGIAVCAWRWRTGDIGAAS